MLRPTDNFFSKRRAVGLGSFYQLQDLVLEVSKFPGSFRKLSMKILLSLTEFLTKTLIFDWKRRYFSSKITFRRCFGGSFRVSMEVPRNFRRSSSRVLRGDFRLENFRALAKAALR